MSMDSLEVVSCSQVDDDHRLRRYESVLAEMKCLIVHQKKEIESLRESVNVLSRREALMARAYDALYKFWLDTSAECQRLADANHRLSDVCRRVTTEVGVLRRQMCDAQGTSVRRHTRV